MDENGLIQNRSNVASNVGRAKLVVKKQRLIIAAMIRINYDPHCFLRKNEDHDSPI